MKTKQKTTPNPKPTRRKPKPKSYPLPARVLGIASITGQIAGRLGRTVEHECARVKRWEGDTKEARRATIELLKSLRKSASNVRDGLGALTKHLEQIIDDPSGGHSILIGATARAWKQKK